LAPRGLTCPFSGGPKAALGSAIACGILLGVFEGVGVLFSRVFGEGLRPQLPQCERLRLLLRIPLTKQFFSSTRDDGDTACNAIDRVVWTKTTRTHLHPLINILLRICVPINHLHRFRKKTGRTVSIHLIVPRLSTSEFVTSRGVCSSDVMRI